MIYLQYIRTARNSVMIDDNYSIFDAEKVKRICNGMLPTEVYSALYEEAYHAPKEIFVEVGTAHAAATVSLAMGLRDSGRKGKVYTFEKVIGGSREKFGSIDENTEIIKRNLQTFNVDNLVVLTIGDVAETADVLPKDITIGLLCLDADGAIDRDFGLFFNRLANEAPIIVDDSRDYTRIKLLGRSGLRHSLFIDQKHRLTFRLLEKFRLYDLVKDGKIHGTDTWIGKKGAGQYANIGREDVLNVYRSIIFTEASFSFMPFRSVLAKIFRTILPATLITKLRTIERGNSI
jgi:hypothetical protein